MHMKVTFDFVNFFFEQHIQGIFKLASAQLHFMLTSKPRMHKDPDV